MARVVYGGLRHLQRNLSSTESTVRFPINEILATAISSVFEADKVPVERTKVAIAISVVQSVQEVSVAVAVCD